MMRRTQYTSVQGVVAVFNRGNWKLSPAFLKIKSILVVWTTIPNEDMVPLVFPRSQIAIYVTPDRRAVIRLCTHYCPAV